MTFPYRQLQEFLAASHADHELRALAFSAFADAPAIFRAMPGAGASASELAFALTATISRHYGDPPESLWQYLEESREARRAEIERLRANFAANARTPEMRGPAPAVAGPRMICVRPGGAQDLLVIAELSRDAGSSAGGDSPEAELLRGPLADLGPGQVNGLARVFTLRTTEQHLEVHATPSLYRHTQRLPPALRLTLPVEGERYRYFPRGRGSYRPGQAGAHVLQFLIERWDRGGGRVAFLTVPDHRWTIQFGL